MCIYQRSCHYSDIIKILELLRKNYTITDEGEMEEYLGIKLERTDDTIKMSQPLLINRIIETIPGMKKANPVFTISHINKRNKW